MILETSNGLMVVGIACGGVIAFILFVIMYFSCPKFFESMEYHENKTVPKDIPDNWWERL